MNRTAQITAIVERLNDGCLGDAEYCALHATLLDLDPASTQSSGAEPALEPPF